MNMGKMRNVCVFGGGTSKQRTRFESKTESESESKEASGERSKREVYKNAACPLPGDVYEIKMRLDARVDFGAQSIRRLPRQVNCRRQRRARPKRTYR